MRWFLSGEGASDLGVESARGFKPGPMALLLAKMATKLGESLGFNEDADFEYVHKARLGEEAAGMPAAKKSIRLPGLKKKKETGYFFNNARALARIAKRYQADNGDAIVAVLFRDADGTASAGRGNWQDKYNSMLHGFAQERLDTGVAMLPKPKSEAWLLCALRANPYQNCAGLENRSGNDASPNSLKGELAQLASALDVVHLAVDVVQWSCQKIESGDVDPEKINMPSFTAFRNALKSALQPTR
ncbi:MAG: hypothetical protein HKL96_01290 [Phycisphaerales bacterium]|nr:hypothetical protein [Phycisphaerales bacterium]